MPRSERSVAPFVWIALAIAVALALGLLLRVGQRNDESTTTALADERERDAAPAPAPAPAVVDPTSVSAKDRVEVVRSTLRFHVVDANEAPIEGVAVASTCTWARFVDASAIVTLGVTDADGTFALDDERWRRHDHAQVPTQRFVARLAASVQPFVRTGPNTYRCRVRAHHDQVVHCRDEAGRAIAGVRIAIGRHGVPHTAVELADGDARLADMTSDAHAIHVAISDANGDATFRGVAEGDHAFDIAAEAHVRVGGPDPDADRLRVPSPPPTLVLREVFVCVAEIPSASIVSLEIEQSRVASAAPMGSGREIRRISARLRRDFGNPVVALVATARDATPTDQMWADVRALVHGVAGLSFVDARVPFVRWTRDLRATVIEAKIANALPAGRVTVVVTDSLGGRYPNVRGQLVRGPKPGGGIPVESGVEALVPAGEYEIRFADRGIASVAGAHRVNVTPDGAEVVTVVLPEVLVPVRVVLTCAHGPGALGGVMVRVRSDSGPPHFFGGDGLESTETFWVRPGRLQIDATCPGYAADRVDVVVTGSAGSAAREIVIPMRSAR
jgi:hypothetical protein